MQESWDFSLDCELYLTGLSLSPQLISSKVPKAEYIPTIIRRDDPSIIPILYVSVLSSSASIQMQTLGIPLPSRSPSQCLNALGDQQGL